MDPKQNSKSLDPKLQAAYDRVMGISMDSLTQSSPTSAAPGDTATLTAPQNPLTTSTDPAMPATTTGDLTQLQPASPLGATASPASPTPDVTTAQPDVPPVGQDAVSSTPAPVITPPAVDPMGGSTNPAANDLSQANPSVMTPSAVTPPSTDPLSAPATMPPSSDPLGVPAATPPAATESLNSTMPLSTSSETVKISSFTNGAKKTGKGISPSLIIFGGVVFLIVYVLFWVKVFGLSLPFLPQ